MDFVLPVLVLAAVATVLGDLVHGLLHAGLEARGPLRWPGLLHLAHHRFLDERLAFHDDRFWRNVALHQLPELVMRSSLSTGVGLVFGVAPEVVAVVVGLFVLECAGAIVRRGRDRLHRPARPVGPPQGGLFVDANYHAHHHAFPGYFLSAHLQVVDRLLGRLLPLAGRAVVVIGGSRFCAGLASALEAEGATVRCMADDAIEIEGPGGVAAADIVVLGHGAGRRDGVAYEAILAETLAVRAAPLPLEVWAVGDDEAWAGRRGLFADRVVLRVLRRAPMIRPTTTLFWLKRGVRVL